MIKPSKEKLLFEQIEIPAEKVVAGIIINDPYTKRDGNTVHPFLGKLISVGEGVKGYRPGNRYYYNPYDVYSINEDGKTYDIVALAGMLCGIDE